MAKKALNRTAPWAQSDGCECLFFFGCKCGKTEKVLDESSIFSRRLLGKSRDAFHFPHFLTFFLGCLAPKKMVSSWVFRHICPVEESLLAGARFPGVATGSRWKIDVVAIGRMWTWNTMGW